ncbi:MAG: chromosome segregation protein SMC [Oscillospiraceae bacterium]|jgi:chromosome segregation protein|nr:chromosome segregation protein SMC [Oscillospiraceae bacterium]
MFLKSLQIQGFKSFPDKIIIDFAKGITCIVGPNGSGKSNISDAVRWVLGEQSPRVLRIKQTEGVIFGGTTQRKALGFAEVVLSFDNRDRALHSDSDEVAILRRFYRNGKSEYKINGISVRLQDITELFMDTGLGKNGYSIIGQGKVSAIVEAKSDERRAIFEEAAGISKFRHRKLEAERNLRKAEENLVHLEVLYLSLEERVGPLEREAEKAKKYNALRDKLKSAEIGSWLATLSSSNAVLADQSYKLLLTQSQQEDTERLIDKLEAEVERLFAESNALIAKKDEIMRNSSLSLEEANAKENEALLVESDAGHKMQDAERLRGELVKASESDSLLLSEIEEKNAAAAERETLIAELSLQHEQMSGELIHLSGTSGSLNSQIEELTARQNALSLGLSEARFSLSSAQEQLTQLSEDSERREETAAATEKRIGELKESLQETKEAATLAEEKLSSLRNSESGYKLRLQKQRDKLEEAKNAADKLSLDAEELSRKARIIEDLEKNLEGFAYSVKKVMGYAEKGVLKGIHGPVSRLISPEEKYAAAIETALGAALQNIVTDTQEDAKHAINQLKRDNAGRATFLPISAITARELREPSLELCDGYVGIASELVSFDARYAGIIGSLLGRICVAEDINSAIAIAKRYKYQFKVVTLDGQVINAGGSMTGGSMAKNSGILSRKHEIERLHENAAEILLKAEEARKRQRELREKVSADEAALLSVSAAISNTSEDLSGFRADIRLISGQIEQSEEQLEFLKNTSLQTERQIALCKEKITQSEEQISSLSDRAKETEAEFAEQMGRRDELEGKRQEISERLSDISMKKLSAEKEIEAMHSSAEDLRLRLGRQAELSESMRGEVEHLLSENQNLLAQAALLREEAVSLRANGEQLRNSVSDISAQREGIEAQITNARKESRSRSEEKEALSREIARLEEKQANTQAEYNKIISQLLEEYNLTRWEAEALYEPAEDVKRAAAETQEIKNAIRRLGNVNVGAIEEYKEVFEKYTLYKTQIEDVGKAREELISLIEDLTRQMSVAFAEKFDEINRHFRSIFKELFGGGEGDLELTDMTDILNSGIEISAQLPGKSVKNIESFSGGEKTIIAVAIYFAIMKVNPSPFCFLDEIDSALDENNIVNIARYVERMSDATQYIIITHRRGTMEVANTIYGVAMQNDGESKVLGLNVREIEEKLGIS